MSRNNNNNYKEHQDRYEELHEDWVKYSNNWSDDEKRNHLENMKISNDEELRGREEATEEWGDDGDEGHENRINEVKGTGQLLGHSIAHARGEYEYQTGRMQDIDEDLRRQLEHENNEHWGYSPPAQDEHVEEREEESEEESEEEPEPEDSDMDTVSDSD